MFAALSGRTSSSVSADYQARKTKRAIVVQSMSLNGLTELSNDEVLTQATQWELQRAGSATGWYLDQMGKESDEHEKRSVQKYNDGALKSVE
jgi:hypothetical protein